MRRLKILACVASGVLMLIGAAASGIAAYEARLARLAAERAGDEAVRARVVAGYAASQSVVSQDLILANDRKGR